MTPTDPWFDDLYRWIDDLYDEEVGLLWNPTGSFEDEGLPARSLHLLPQSGFYAVSLADRGETDALATVVDALLGHQYREPGEPYDGTFARFAEWPPPGPDAVEWEDYDPNWRQFLGCTLTLLRRRFPDALEPERADRVDDAIRYAVAGEPADRLDWTYTNISLKHAFLLCEWGDVERGTALASQIHEHWSETGSFPEFNSPTYDALDLWALALWRSESSVPELRAWGAEMEAGLWRTIASRYHADLGNIAGPYGRAYGLDMERYVGKVGVWIGLALGSMADAPLPPLGRGAHTHDFVQAHAAAVLGTEIPDEARARLQTFDGERSSEELVTSWPTRRQATSWLGDDLMVGGEHGDSDWSGWYQFVAGTAHWRRPDGAIGVARVVPDGAPKLRARPGLLRSEGRGYVEIHQPSDELFHSTRHGPQAPGVSVLHPGDSAIVPGAKIRVVADGLDGWVLEVTPR